MWIFSKHGFYSVTRSATTKGMMQIRARCCGDLMNLKSRFDLAGKIIETPQADYRWRILCRPSTWEMLAVKLAQDVDYSNFKNSVGNDQHDKPLFQVWSAMQRFQEDKHGREGRFGMPLFDRDEEEETLATEEP